VSRASFGGAQDQSIAFATYYRDYEDRLQTLANRAEGRAIEEQNAADSDAIDRWQSGEMSDAQFLAYAEKRRQQSAGEDPEAESYWKKVLRDARKKVLAEEVNDGAEDLIDKINVGKASWDDLLSFYRDHLTGLGKNDPLRKDIGDQMEQVRDRIAQNEVEGRFSQIQYNFQAGKINGSTAAAQIRALAQRYKQNDPARYYQMLGQALDLARYGGFAGSGGGGRGGSGGSGGGGGRGSASSADLEDVLKIREDQFTALSNQFEDGAKVGEITVTDGRGRVHTQEVLLANPDGTPSDQMRQIDSMMLDNYDRLISVLTRQGSSEAGTKIKAKSDFITDHIQPRNTILPQRQAQSMLTSGFALVESAADADDPVAAWGQVQSWAKDVTRWRERLNKSIKNYKLAGKELELTRAIAPGLTDAQINTSAKEKSLEGRTTDKFERTADALTDFALAVANGDEAAMRKAWDALDSSNQSPFGESNDDLDLPSSFTNTQEERIARAIDLVKGIPEGRYARVIVPGQGMVYAPVQQTYSTVIGPDGQPQSVVSAVPVNPSTGVPLADPAQDQQLVDVMVEIDGRVQMVKAISQPTYYVGGESVTKAQYDSAFRQYQDAKTGRGGSNLPEPLAYQQVLIPGRNGGNPEVWLLDPSRNLWFRNRVTKAGGVPLIFNGANAQLAQQVADQLGIDQSGTSYYNAPAVEAARSTNRAGFQGKAQGDDWYSEVLGISKQELAKQRRVEFAQAIARPDVQRAGAGLLGSATDILQPFAGGLIADSLKALGQTLGIKSFQDQERIQNVIPPSEHDGIKPVSLNRLPKIDVLTQPDRKPLPDLSIDLDEPRRKRRRLTPPPTADRPLDYEGKAPNIPLVV
jgi:hypothetical protein